MLNPVAGAVLAIAIVAYTILNNLIEFANAINNCYKEEKQIGIVCGLQGV